MAANFSTQRKSKLKSRRKKPLHQQRVKQIDVLAEQRCQRSVSLFIHLVRLIIGGLGASAIAGTVISITNPPKPQLAPKVAGTDPLQTTSSSSKPPSKIDPGFPNPVLIKTKPNP